MDKPRIITYAEKQVNYTIFDVKWIPCSAKFLVLGSKPKGTGVLEIFELNSGKVDTVKEVERKLSFKCGSFGASSLRDRHIAIGDFSGRLQVLDLERPEISVYNVEAHKGIVNSLDGIGGTQINCGAPEIVTGGQDGSVKVWDLRQNDGAVVDISAKGSEEGREKARDCWSVTFGNSYNNEERIIAAGYDNGDLKLFDLRTLEPLWEYSQRNGICCIEFDRKDIPMNKMVVTTLEGGLHVYDMRVRTTQNNFACVSEENAGRSLGKNGCITGPRATVWAARHVPQNRDLFMTCGGTGSVRLWEYVYPEKRVTDPAQEPIQNGSLKMLHAATVSTQPINSFDWNPNKLGLAVCGAFDQTVRVLVTTKLNLY